MKEIDWNRPTRTIPSGYDVTDEFELDSGNHVVIWVSPTPEGNIDSTCIVDAFGRTIDIETWASGDMPAGIQIVENVPEWSEMSKREKIENLNERIMALEDLVL